jgi:hypothetical protein
MCKSTQRPDGRSKTENERCQSPSSESTDLGNGHIFIIGPLTENDHTSWDFDFADHCASRKPADLAPATPETELQTCEEVAVFESSLIDDLNERRNDDPLDTAIREPANILSARAGPSVRDFANELRKISGGIHSIESGYARVPDRQYRREPK